MPRLLSFAVFVATWWIASLLIGDAKLPPPPTVLAAMATEAKSGALFFNLGATLARVALAFVLAMSLGSAIGYLMGRVRLADRICDPWLILLLNLPALVSALLMGDVLCIALVMVAGGSTGGSLPILLFPVAVPLLIAALRASSGILAGVEWAEIGPWFNILIGYDVIFIAAAFMLFEFVVEE